MVRPKQQSNRERDMSEERPKRDIKYKIIKEEREPNKKIFFVIPSSYKQLLKIETAVAIAQIFLVLPSLLYCVFGVLVTKGPFSTSIYINSFQFFWKYMWLKMFVKICKMLFEN